MLYYQQSILAESRDQRVCEEGRKAWLERKNLCCGAFWTTRDQYENPDAWEQESRNQKSVKRHGKVLKINVVFLKFAKGRPSRVISFWTAGLFWKRPFGNPGRGEQILLNHKAEAFWTYTTHSKKNHAILCDSISVCRSCPHTQASSTCQKKQLHSRHIYRALSLWNAALSIVADTNMTAI